MPARMPCSITDGRQFEDGFADIEDEDTAYERVRQEEIDMETITAQIERANEIRARNEEGRSSWLYRRANALIDGAAALVDPRNQEQLVLGAQLQWRLLLRRYELKAGLKHL